MADRVAVITGAAGTLGRVVARDLHQDGMRLGLVGTRRERLEALATELGLPSDSYLVEAADLRDEGTARATVAAVHERFGALDVLIHVVGGWTGGTELLEIARADVEAMLAQHLWTTFAMVRAAAPQMLERGWGRIVVVSSPAAADPPPKMAAYAVAKAAQEALLRSFARELEGSGVTANILLVRAIAEAGVTAPPRGSTRPEAIAGTIRWLCSDEAGAVNGARIPLFGG